MIVKTKKKKKIKENQHMRTYKDDIVSAIYQVQSASNKTDCFGLIHHGMDDID